MNENNKKLNEKFKNSISEMEKKLEEKENIHQNEIIQLNKNSEETLNQLKTLFENEKMRLEEKLREEKEKYEKKIETMTDDYENKLKDQENELKEENENLQNDLNDLNQGHNQFVTNAEHEFELLNQKILTLNASLK